MQDPKAQPSAVPAPLTAAEQFEAEPSPTGTPLPNAGSATPELNPRDTAPPRVHYAFAAHLERAELRRGETQLFDFGAPGDAAYTLGGWLSAASETRVLDGRHARVTRGRSAKLQIASDHDGARGLQLALRSFVSTRVYIYLNGKRLAESPLSGQQFETLSIPVPDGVLTTGENTLDLRVGLAAASGEGLAIDFVALTPPDAAYAEPIPPGPADLHPEGEPETLRVPAGATVSYTLQVPAGAALRAQVSSANAAQLRVRALRDGEAPLELVATEIGPTPKMLHAALEALDGTTARFDFEASGDAVQLARPNIVLSPNAEPERGYKPIRNVVLFLIDTLRADKLSPYNPATRVSTPGLTRFLEDAAVMLRARAQECWTKPSVATLLSALFPWQHSAFTDAAVLPEPVELLPEHLSRHGYFTGAFVANGYISDKFGFKQGFDTFRNYIREGRRSVAQAVAADVLDWLDGRPQDKPFFLYVHTIDPHVPYQPPRDFLGLYDTQPYEGPIDFRRGGELLEQIKARSVTVNDRDKERLVALYDGEISYHDVHFDAIMRGLEARGLADDTLVVITADHGEEFWDHGSVGHGHSVFDELVHIPLLVRLPGLTRGGAGVAADVGLVDVAPTILDAVGLTPPETMSGRSFLPELRGETSDAPRWSVAGFMTGWRSVSVGRWKLVQRELTKHFLYDTLSDPGETRDLSAERPLTVRYLRGMLGLALARNDAAPQSRVVYAPQQTAIDAATEQQLRALGYVGSSRH